MHRHAEPNPHEVIRISFFADGKVGMDLRELEFKIPIGTGRWACSAAISGLRKFFMDELPEEDRKIYQSGEESEKAINRHLEDSLSKFREAIANSEKEKREKSEKNDDKEQPTASETTGQDHRSDI